MKIKDLKKNDLKKDIFLLINNLSQKETTSHKPFVSFTFSDGTDTICGNMWGETIDSLGVKEGEIVKVRADVNEWQNNLQLTVIQIRGVQPADNIDEADFYKASPIKGEELYNSVLEIAKKNNNKVLKDITVKVLKKYKDILLYYPGAKCVHHAEKSGLLYHIYRMLKSANSLKEIYSFNSDLLESGIILHDIGKLYELDVTEHGVATDYTIDGNLLGHIVLGIKELSIIANNLKYDETEEFRLLEHMIISHHGEIEYGSVKTPMFLEAQLLNTLDVLDSKAFMFEEYNQKLEGGTLSDKDFFLQRKIYKPNL